MKTHIILLLLLIIFSCLLKQINSIKEGVTDKKEDNKSKFKIKDTQPAESKKKFFIF